MQDFFGDDKVLIFYDICVVLLDEITDLLDVVELLVEILLFFLPFILTLNHKVVALKVGRIFLEGLDIIVGFFQTVFLELLHFIVDFIFKIIDFVINVSQELFLVFLSGDLKDHVSLVDHVYIN